MSVQNLKRVTIAVWVLTFALMIGGIVVGSVAAQRTALLLGMLGIAIAVGFAIRWGSTVLVHVLALYNDDLPTPEGDELLRSVLPPPKHVAADVE